MRKRKSLPFKNIIIPLLVITISFIFTNIVWADGGDSSLIHACIKNSTGIPKIVGINDTCGASETASHWLKDVFAGAGLTATRDITGVTLSITNGGVTTAMLANGAVTTDKIADGSVTQAKLASAPALLADIKAYQVNPTDGQTTTSTSYADMANGTQQIVLSKKSVVYINAHANVIAPLLSSFDFNDRTANGNNLTNNNGVAEETTSLPFSASTFAAKFAAASSQNFSMVTSASLKPTGAFTIEFWARFPTTNARYGLFQSYSENGVKVGGFRVETDSSTGKIYFLTGKDTGFTDNVDYKDILGTTDVMDDTWHHIACVYDQTNVIIYVDGTAQTTESWSNNPAYNATTYQRIGVSNSTGTNISSTYAEARIDDVRLWNVARTQSQIDANKSVELVGNESGLVAYYPFESNTANGSLAYLRTTYDSGGADTEIGTQGYTNTTLDGQSISAGGVTILNPGTYTVAVQKKVNNSSGTSAAYNQPGMSIMIVPTE